MTTYKLLISHNGASSWSASALLTDGEGVDCSYFVSGESLEELRELVRQGSYGDLGIYDVEFEEVFIDAQENVAQ